MSRQVWCERHFNARRLASAGHSLVRDIDADHVLGEFGLAFDAALALRDHEGLEALLAQAAQDLDGRDVGVAIGAAGVLAGGEDRRRDSAHLFLGERRLAAQGERIARKARRKGWGCVHDDSLDVWVNG